MEKYKSVLIYGPPGSGKGTISKFLNLSDEVCHVSTGDIFRGLHPESKMGKVAKTYIDKGHLIPDDITVEIWHEFVLDLIKEKKFIPEKHFLLLDGIPRTLKQAILLEKYISVEYIIVLEVKNTNVIIDRMQKRALIENRADDANIDVLNKRIQIYQEDTSKLLKHYPNEKIYNFNGDQKKLEVIRDVLIKFANILE